MALPNFMMGIGNALAKPIGASLAGLTGGSTTPAPVQTPVVRPPKAGPGRGQPVAMAGGVTNYGPGVGGAQGRPQQQQQIKPGQVQGQQQIDPNMLMLLQMMQQRQQPQPMQQQPQQPAKPSYNTPAPYGNQSAVYNQGVAQAQYGQNAAMQQGINQINNPAMRVSGPLQSVTSGVQGNDLQNPGLYQASMAGRGGGESMNQYFGSHNERAYSLGFSGMDDPRYTQWVQQNGVNGNAAIGPGNNGGGGGSGGSGATGGASGGTTGGAGATNPTQDLLGNLFNNYQSQMDAANAANEARYGQGLEELQSLRSRSQNDINRLGSQQAQDIRKDANRTNAAALQNATARGLGNSTMPAIMQRGVQRDKTDALNRLGDSVAGQRLNADNQLTGNITNWIYNKNDNAPDFGQLIDLAKLYGESGYGQPQQQQGVPQLPPLDLSGLQGLLNGLGGIGQQLPQLMMPQLNGAQGNNGQQGQTGQAGQQQQPNLSQYQNYAGNMGLPTSALLQQLAPYFPQAGQAIGQGTGQFFSDPYNTIQQGASGAASGITNLLGSNGLAGMLGNLGSMVGQVNAMAGAENSVMDSGMGQPSLEGITSYFRNLLGYS